MASKSKAVIPVEPEKSLVASDQMYWLALPVAVVKFRLYAVMIPPAVPSELIMTASGKSFVLLLFTFSLYTLAIKGNPLTPNPKAGGVLLNKTSD